MILGNSLWNTITGNIMNEKETQLKNFLAYIEEYCKSNGVISIAFFESAKKYFKEEMGFTCFDD